MNLFVLLLAAATVVERAPEECLVLKGKAAASATYAGKTYGFRYAECREQFLADPERYSQLYDALRELAAEGAALAPPAADESLVPS